MQWSMNWYLFAPICTYVAYKMHENKQTSIKTYKYNLYKFARLYIYIYAYMATYIYCTCPACICIYGDIYPIYIAHTAYIYMQRETLKYLMQATGAAGSCSQHGITKHQSPPEATCRFLSRNISIAQAQSRT